MKSICCCSICFQFLVLLFVLLNVKSVCCCYICFQFLLFCLYIVDNPMVVLGYRQASQEIMDHMAQNERGDVKFSMYPAVDLRDITFEKYKQVSEIAAYSNEFSNIDDDGIDTCFHNFKLYAEAVIIGSIYGVSECGFVNNCPFQGEENSRYRMDLGEINEQLRGLSICVVKSEIVFTKCFHYSYDMCLIVLARSRTVQLYTKTP